MDRALRGRVRALLRSGDFSGRAGETLLMPEIARHRQRSAAAGRARAPRRSSIAAAGAARCPARSPHSRARACARRALALERPARARAGRYLLRSRSRGDHRRRPLSHQRSEDRTRGRARRRWRACWSDRSMQRAVADVRRGLAAGAAVSRERGAAAQSRQPARPTSARRATWRLRRASSSAAIGGGCACASSMRPASGA